MEKRNYVKPILSGEEFIPQNYIAACGDGGTVYKFKCNAGGGKYGSVYYETNRVAGLQVPSCHCENVPIIGKHSSSLFCDTWGQGDDTHATDSFHACVNDENTEGIHEASSTSEFINGYYVAGGVVTPVIIWTGINKDNVHCTTALDQSSWEIAKS